MKGANAKFSLQEAHHRTTHLVFLYFRKQSNRGASTPGSAYPEILNTLGLSLQECSQVRFSTWASVACAAAAEESSLGSLFDRINLYLKSI